VRIREARQEDAAAVAELLHESSPRIYDRFAGNRERALRILREAYGRPGTVASRDVVSVLDLDGRTAAAMAAFPIAEGPDRARGFVRLALRRVPFWLWLRTLRLYTTGTRVAREDALYIDALATAADLRRRGAARALLEEAERAAGERGLRAVTLDTTLDNDAARALYRSAGFDEVAYRSPTRSMPGFVALLKPLGR
jgi:ribosomal protein S18 acetylase RimI-like enzyme